MLIIHLGGGEAPRKFTNRLLEYVEVRQQELTMTFVVFRNFDGVLVQVGILEIGKDETSVAVAWLHDVLLTPRIDATSVSVICWCPEAHPHLALDLLNSIRKDYVLVYETLQHDAVLAKLDNASVACLVTDESLAHAWSQKKYSGCTVIRPDRDPISDVIEAVSTQHLLPSFSSQIEALGMDQYRRNLLLISYFGASQALVSTQRLSYWSEELPKLAAKSGLDLSVTWLSATRQAIGAPNCVVIPDFGALRKARQRKDYDLGDYIPKAVNGFSWATEVMDSFNFIEQRFDTVIVSMGPFGYIHLGEYFKSRWNCKVILDFRDPFGGDQRIGYPPESREEINRYEQRAVINADAVLSVNKFCLEVISPEIKVDRYIIPNGYDERRFDRSNRESASSIKRANERRFIYIGTIFPDLDLNHLVSSLDPSRDKLIHYGRNLSEDDFIRNSAICELNGQTQDQLKLAYEMSVSDVGVIRLGGEATTQTTKIFDYVGAGLEILILSNGDLYSGGVHEITSELEGIHWVKNDAESIQQFLESYQPSPIIRRNADGLSRKSAAVKLLEVLKDIDRDAELVSRLRNDNLEIESGSLGGALPTKSSESFDLIKIEQNLDRIDSAVDRVSRGHLSNARSIQNLAKRVQDLELLVDEVNNRLTQRNRKRGQKFVLRQKIRKVMRRGSAGSNETTLTSRSYVAKVQPSAMKPEVRRRLTVLLVCPAYPLHSRLYGGQFVQDRVANYVSNDIEVTVFVPSKWSELIDVEGPHGERFIQGPLEQLGQRVLAISPDVICVHSVSTEVWSVLNNFREIPKIFWFHGFEARPWLSMAFNYLQTEREAQGPRLNALDTTRKIMLREIFSDSACEAVFVSNFMKETACQFVGRSPERFHIIGNPLNDIFNYQVKERWQGKRILSVSSYSARTYATDITAKAISNLLASDRNRELRVTLVGSGRYFEEDTAQFGDDTRVELHEAVLDRNEMYELFRNHGIFLKPSRWDSQGITTLEAMACGMIPVTSLIGGIPEFIGSSCGRFGDNDDPGSFSRIIEGISADPDLFESLSASSALAGQSYRARGLADREIAIISSAALGRM